jgi:hypothetical protein
MTVKNDKTGTSVSQPSFTPGPWRRGQEGNLRIYGPSGQYEHSGLLAEVFPKNGAQTANAQLIASAPELLEALEALMKAVTPELTGSTKNVPKSIWASQWDKAEEICRKARSQQP